MLVAPLVVLSVLGSALAVPNLGARHDGFTDQDLLDSCPGGPGSKVFKHADRCTLREPVTVNPNVRKWAVVGDPQLNCGGGSDPITVELGGEHTVSQTVSVDANFGVNIDGLSIGGGVSSSNEDSMTVSKKVSYMIRPNRQAVFVAGTAHQSRTSQIQVNFGSRQRGHFIWFSDARVTQLTPIPDDVEFDVYESDCGTDPRDLSSLDTTA
ncbi:hypothetical protein C8Q77DRAFT_1244792 [Trametes polyzona]|nr:hypothetical protein C8Q77DRAFT_1244792 [Trametes polyzona]